MKTFTKGQAVWYYDSPLCPYLAEIVEKPYDDLDVYLVKVTDKMYASFLQKCQGNIEKQVISEKLYLYSSDKNELISDLREHAYKLNRYADDLEAKNEI